MPTLSSKTECKEHGCHTTTTGDYCAKHKKANKRIHRRRRVTGGDSSPYRQGSQWRKVSALVLKRDPICKGYKVECDAPSYAADHITPWKQYGGDFYDMDNLQGLCRSCHSRKTFDGL